MLGFDAVGRLALGQVPTLSPGNVNIVGVSGTGQVGTAVAEVDSLRTGVVGTGATGSVIPTVSLTTTGVVGVGAAGTVTILTGFLFGVQGSGQVGSLTPSIAFGAAGVSAAGFVGTVSISKGPQLIGVAGTGIANDVYAIPPAPLTRPPLFIPKSSDGTPASLWLGSTNGNGTTL